MQQKIIANEYKLFLQETEIINKTRYKHKPRTQVYVLISCHRSFIRIKIKSRQ